MNSARILEGTLLSTSEAAKMINTSRRYLENLRIVGGGPVFVRLSSKLVRYRIEDLTEWIEDRTRSSTSDPGPDKQPL